jgi:uncharacterized membrane protein
MAPVKLERRVRMNESQEHVARLSDTARVEAFSDGVFAIIITLLVLDLRKPEVGPGQLLSGLLQQWPTYLAYVTSFLYVGVVWQNHRAAFNRICLIDRGLHWTKPRALVHDQATAVPHRSRRRRGAARQSG